MSSSLPASSTSSTPPWQSSSTSPWWWWSSSPWSAEKSWGQKVPIHFGRSSCRWARRCVVFFFQSSLLSSSSSLSTMIQWWWMVLVHSEKVHDSVWIVHQWILHHGANCTIQCTNWECTRAVTGAGRLWRRSLPFTRDRVSHLPSNTNAPNMDKERQIVQIENLSNDFRSEKRIQMEDLGLEAKS